MRWQITPSRADLTGNQSVLYRMNALIWHRKNRTKTFQPEPNPLFSHGGMIVQLEKFDPLTLVRYVKCSVRRTASGEL